MMVSVWSVKNSLRIDHNADDELLEYLIYLAEEYICQAITGEKDHFSEIKETKHFPWAVSLLAQHWYLNREEVESRHTPVAVTSLIQQMRGVYYANH